MMDIEVLKGYLLRLLPPNTCVASCLLADFQNVLCTLEDCTHFVIIIFDPSGKVENAVGGPIARGHFTSYIRSTYLSRDWYIDTTAATPFSQRFPLLHKLYSPKCLPFRVQSYISNLCGIYIIAFALLCFDSKVNAVVLNEFCAQFSKQNLVQNDLIMLEFFTENGQLTG